jgi:hypothetical protein
MKLIQNSKNEIHINDHVILKDNHAIGYESLCHWSMSGNLFEGDISQVTCKRCLKAYKEVDDK